jgi:dihydropteroate synthase
MKQRVTLVGVINVSPESFYKASVHRNDAALTRAARQMKQDGADVIDVGAMSTAPYLKTKISEQAEAERLAHAVRVLKRATDLPISADTARARPADAALKAGALYLNDVTGLHGDPEFAKVARRARRVILMAHPSASTFGHARSPIDGVVRSLRSSLRLARQARIPLDKIVLDPGIGFFRDTRWPWWKWDLNVLKNIARLEKLGRPLLVGVSRKSFIGAALGQKKPQDRLPGSLAATTAAVLNGATWVRTHDVKDTRSALTLIEQIRNA